MAYTSDNQIGEVTEVTGAAKIIHTDGTSEPIMLGTEIHQGDIIETEGTSAVNILFIDESTFAVSDNARIAIDEFVFDPQSESGAQDFSITRGVFMYTSGLIGRENPDSVEIDTPVGSIGIRGTIIGGNISETGESQVSVIEGAIVVRNNGGEQLLTNQFDTVTLSSMDIAPSAVQTLDVTRVANDYGAVKDVSSTLFSSFNDQIQQEQEGVSSGLDSADIAPEEALQDDGEQEDIQANDNNQPAPEQPIQELAPEIQKLNTLPEIKTIDIDINKMDTTKAAPSQTATSNTVQSAQQTDINPTAAPFVAPPIQVVFNGGINEANGTTAYSVAGPLNVGQVAVQHAANVQYQLVNTYGGRFSIDNTGSIFFNGGSSHMLDYEKGEFFNLGIRATNLDTGVISNGVFRLGLNNVNEAPKVLMALEDVYDVGSLANPNDDIGIIAQDVFGAQIAKLAVNDPDGETFSVASFTVGGTITGQPATNFLEVIQNPSDGEFYLALKPAYQIDSATNTIFDGVSSLTIGLPASLNLSIQVIDSGGLTHTQPISLNMGQVTNVAGTSAFTASATDDIIIGDNLANTIHLGDHDYKYINGGDGNDKLILDNAGLYNFDLTTSNTLNADLSSIEEIVFNDAQDTLAIDVDHLMQLLKTSNHITADGRELIISTNAIGTGDGTVNAITFEDAAGTNIKLTDIGFVKMADTIDSSGQSYDVFKLAGVGTVVIESQIVNADTGGL